MRIKLFCFPYAGGFASKYFPWKQFTDDMIEIVPIEYPGRGSRSNIPCCTNLNNIADDAFKFVSQEIQDYPYVFFGHSFGTLVAYETLIKLRQNNFKEPVHIIFSSHESPDLKPLKIHYNLPDNEFIEEVLKNGGMPREIVENSEMLDYFMKPLRADYQADETYVYKKHDKFGCDISVFRGKYDIDFNLVKNWANVTTGECRFYKLNGSHFYITEYPEQVMELVKSVLYKYAFDFLAASDL